MGKVRTHEFLRQERELDINRGNKKLLEKLVEISKGKHVSRIRCFHNLIAVGRAHNSRYYPSGVDFRRIIIQT
jgi:hypothetical protein